MYLTNAVKSCGANVLMYLFVFNIINSVSCSANFGLIAASIENSEESENSVYDSVTEKLSESVEAEVKLENDAALAETNGSLNSMDIVLGANDTSLVATNVTSNVTVSEHEIECTPRNLTENETLEVKLVNNTLLLDYLKAQSNTTKSECVLVMFYYRWCVFSAKAAVHYNALPRIYPQMHVLAIDAYVHNSINMRFGLVGVPSVLLFHNGKIVGKHNDSDPSIEGFVSFIHKTTGLQTMSEVAIEEEDKLGPVPTEPEQRLDLVLVLSCLFIATSLSYLFSKSSLFLRIMENVRNTWREAEAQHEHLD